jgi:hypothetical protein
MQTNSGSLLTLEDYKQFSEMFPPAKAVQDPYASAMNDWLSGAKPVIQGTDGTYAEPVGKSLAEMNDAMKAAGWTRAERRRYLAKAKHATPQLAAEAAALRSEMEASNG